MYPQKKKKWKSHQYSSNSANQSQQIIQKTKDTAKYHKRERERTMNLWRHVQKPSEICAQRKIMCKVYALLALLESYFLLIISQPLSPLSLSLFLSFFLFEFNFFLPIFFFYLHYAQIWLGGTNKYLPATLFCLSCHLLFL